MRNLRRLLAAAAVATGVTIGVGPPSGANPEDGTHEVQAPHTCENQVVTGHPDTGYMYSYSLMYVEQRWIDYGAGMEKQYWHIYAAEVFYGGPPMGAWGMWPVGWAQKHCGSEYYSYGSGTA